MRKELLMNRRSQTIVAMLSSLMLLGLAALLVRANGPQEKCTFDGSTCAAGTPWESYAAACAEMPSSGICTGSTEEECVTNDSTTVKVCKVIYSQEQYTCNAPRPNPVQYPCGTIIYSDCTWVLPNGPCDIINTRMSNDFCDTITCTN
jgi:hypothetical protein